MTQLNPDLTILEEIEKNPDATQASLAARLDVAVGTINWHLKRLIEKGYVKVRRAERKKLRYIITPEGLALRARLAVDYIQTSFRVYRIVRERVILALQEVHSRGFTDVQLQGDGDVADVARLSCMEQGINIVDDTNAPVLKVDDLKVNIEWKDGSKSHDE